MFLERVGPGQSIPDNINVVIEIPLNGEPVKYEIDKQTAIRGELAHTATHDADLPSRRTGHRHTGSKSARPVV